MMRQRLEFEVIGSNYSEITRRAYQVIVDYYAPGSAGDEKYILENFDIDATIKLEHLNEDNGDSLFSGKFLVKIKNQTNPWN